MGNIHYYNKNNMLRIEGQLVQLFTTNE